MDASQGAIDVHVNFNSSSRQKAVPSYCRVCRRAWADWPFLKEEAAAGMRGDHRVDRRGGRKAQMRWRRDDAGSRGGRGGLKYCVVPEYEAGRDWCRPLQIGLVPTPANRRNWCRPLQIGGIGADPSKSEGLLPTPPNRLGML
eukprot:357425-Chlamydomonas_euryale.AAC.1